jgi:hypothetical protein
MLVKQDRHPFLLMSNIQRLLIPAPKYDPADKTELAVPYFSYGK